MSAHLAHQGLVLLLAGGGIAAALIALAKLGRQTFRGVRKSGQVIDVILGTEHAPSLAQRLDDGDAARAELVGEVAQIRAKVTSAALLNGKGDELVRSVESLRQMLGEHIETSDRTHSAMWAAITQQEGETP